MYSPISLAEPGGGGSPPLTGKSSQNIVFSNAGPGPLENHKVTKSAFHDGLSSSETPFKWQCSHEIM